MYAPLFLGKMATYRITTSVTTGLLPRVNLVPRVSHLLAQAREERPWFSSLAWAGR